jgi:hypothetical protein
MAAYLMPHLCLLLLEGRPLLKEGDPHREAQQLVVNVLILSMEHIVCPGIS